MHLHLLRSLWAFLVLKILANLYLLQYIFAKQKFKIKKSLDIFHQNKLEPVIWVAPAHSFDYETLNALKEETNIKIISDGISLFPYYKSGFHFIPQQLWSIKKKTYGLWTVCLHPETMSTEEINKFEIQLSSPDIYNNAISLSNVILSKNDKNILDYFYSIYFFAKFFAGKFYRSWTK